MVIINKKILIVRYLRPNFATDSSVLYSFRDERWYLKGKGVHLEEWRESLLELAQKESESISDCISKLRDNDKIFESSQKKRWKEDVRKLSGNSLSESMNKAPCFLTVW